MCSRRHPASAFTLVEILVSILIFSVVSLAMITILLTATNLFRASERARNSSDLALAALSALDDDFRYMVPPAQNGFFAAQITNPGTDGNCTIGFRILQPDRTLIGSQGAGTDAREIVCWEVLSDPQTGEPVLYRGIIPTDSTGAKTDLQVFSTLLTDMQNHSQPITGTENVREMARGCLHFGVWISTNAMHRQKSRTWTNADDTNADPLPPYGAAVPPGATANESYCTAPTTASPPVPGDPFPESVHISMILAGGLYAPKGILINDTGDTLTIGGIGQIPFQLGAKVKIENEWIALTGIGNNGATVTCDPTARQSTTAPLLRGTYAAHQRGVPVLWGLEYDQTWLLPH